MIFLLQFIQKVFSRLPLPCLKIFARFLAFLFSLNLPKKRIAYRNLKTAFPAKTYPEIILLLKKSYYNFSLSLIETFIAGRLYSNLKFTGNYSLGEPGICTGIHAGSWELVNLFFVQSYKLAVLVKEQKNKKLDQFLNKLRKNQGLAVCFSLRPLIGYLKKGYYLGLVVDHGAEDQAPLASFFGQLVPSPQGAVFLAKKFQKKIYPFFTYRIGDFKHAVKLLDVIEPDSASSKEIASRLNLLYQAALTEHPQEYLWWHKCFKHKKNRKALLLTDRRPGHFKQSQALLAILKKQKDYQIKEKVAVVKYKNPFFRVLANFVANFCPEFAPSTTRFLGFLLKKECYRELTGDFFDIVISTGNFTAPVAKILASSLGARSAVILRTNFAPEKFDLSIIPEHDRVYLTNAVKIKGALTYPLNLDEKKEKCRDFFCLTNTKKAAVFIGGPVSDSDEFLRKLNYFIKQLKSFSLEQGYELLLSTSRRTPPAAEEIIKSQLGDFQNQKALVIAGEKNYDFVFEGFVLAAEITFCSSESISMLTEIASLGKPCICTFLETADDKRKVFLNSMKNEINFLRYPFRIKTSNLVSSRMFVENQKAIEKAVPKLFTVK